MAGLRNYLSKSVICVMVIFFLQRISSPILPNLHQIASEHANDLPAEVIQKVNALTSTHDVCHITCIRTMFLSH